jgi:phosphate transport system ATP-binding protein
LSGIKNKNTLDDIVEQALTEAALWDETKDRLTNHAGSLSGGQQQRMCIARVLAMKPQIIMLDRSCSGLDPISTAKIEDSLRKLKKRFTVIVAPHNVQQAGRISDRVAFMLMGHLIEAGRNARVFSNPKDKRTEDYIRGRFG